MHKYVPTQLQKYDHLIPQKTQHSSLPAEPKRYSKDTQQSIPDNTLIPIDNVKKKLIERTVGSFLRYERTIDSTMQLALSAIAAQQNKPTEKNVERTYTLP